MPAPRSSADVFHAPRHVAVVGASDNVDKIGGRPLYFLRTLGFAGTLYPVNPTRTTVQGLPSYPSVKDLPETPDTAVVAVPGPAAVEAVRECAERGVRGCVVLSSGFAELGEADGIAMQEEMASAAAAAGMRLVGPNAQGTANFATGTILAFSTMFIESPPEDGAVAVVSQSGGMAAVAYSMLRERGIGVRYCHGTGNDTDVSVSDLVSVVLDDPDVRVVLLYAEGMRDAEGFERAARKAVDRGVPIVALVGGASEQGAKAAESHTGALASERVVVDAFLRRLAVRRVASMTELVQSVELALHDESSAHSDTVAGADSLAVVTNSGGVCVLSADLAEQNGLPLAELDPETVARLRAELPDFAPARNPVDMTGALLTDSSLVGRVLGCYPDLGGPSAYLVSLPVAGRGYDVERFVADTAAFAARIRRPVAVVVRHSTMLDRFRVGGLATFTDEADAIRALAGHLGHRAALRSARGAAPLDLRRPAPGGTLRNEADSLGSLAASTDLVRHARVDSAGEAAAAFSDLGLTRAVVKGCTTSVAHKSDHGLVALRIESAEAAGAAAGEILATMDRAGFAADGVIVAEMVDATHEVMVGAHRDPLLGAVVMLGAGGVHVEAMPDFAVLLPPFTVEDARAAITSLRMSALFGGVRGAPPVDLTSWADLAVSVGRELTEDTSTVQSLDLNPVLLVPSVTGTRAVVADAVLIEADHATVPQEDDESTAASTAASTPSGRQA